MRGGWGTRSIAKRPAAFKEYAVEEPVRALSRLYRIEPAGCVRQKFATDRFAPDANEGAHGCFLVLWDHRSSCGWPLAMRSGAFIRSGWVGLTDCLPPCWESARPRCLGLVRRESLCSCPAPSRPRPLEWFDLYFVGGRGKLVE